MQLTDISLMGFLCLGGIRCLSYIPQVIRIARDAHGASAISYTTWCTWTLAHLTTAAYAGLNLNDAYLAAVSCVYAFCCALIIEQELDTTDAGAAWFRERLERMRTAGPPVRSLGYRQCLCSYACRLSLVHIVGPLANHTHGSTESQPILRTQELSGRALS